MVLDDNELFAALLVAALEPNYDVVVGLNGREGLEICLGTRPDLLITDIGMPELDGIQMLTEFQKDSRLSSIPVIVITATHFNTRSRSDVYRYPQVRGILSKISGIDFIMLEVQRVLQASAGPGPVVP